MLTKTRTSDRSDSFDAAANSVLFEPTLQLRGSVNRGDIVRPWMTTAPVVNAVY